MDDRSCTCSYFEPHMGLQGLEVLGYLPGAHPFITKPLGMCMLA